MCSYLKCIEKSEISPLPSNYPHQSSNVNDALTKKAAANIDIRTMGNQGILFILKI